MKKFKTDTLWVMGLIICAASLALLMFIKFTKTPDIIKHVEAYDNNILIDSELKPETVSSPTVVYTDMGVPSGIDTSFKTYMDWRKITNSSSAQYKYIRKFGWCDGEGFMRASGERGLGITDDYYMIALGSYYGTTIGTKYRITTDTGMIFYGVLADVKADIHTNSTNQYARNHDVVEFLVDIRYLNRTVKRMGSANVYMPLNGHIAKIERIDFID